MDWIPIGTVTNYKIEINVKSTLSIPPHASEGVGLTCILSWNL